MSVVMMSASTWPFEPEVAQDARAVLEIQEQEDVLGPDVVVAQPQGPPDGELVVDTVALAPASEGEDLVEGDRPGEDGRRTAGERGAPNDQPDDRPNTALLVIDVQNGVVANAHQRDEVVANISTLVDKARAEDVPVIWVQHSDDELVEGSDGWQFVPELDRGRRRAARPQALRRLVRGHDLESRARRRGVGRLVVTGAQTDACIRCDAPRRVRPRLRHLARRRRPHHRGPHRVRRSPARQGDRAHQHVLDVAGPGRTAGVVETAAVDFGA